MNFEKKIYKCLVLLLLLIASNQMEGQSKLAVFKDSTDNAIDLSNWLVKKKGFLLVPSVITEPALGLGIGGAALFFHSSYEESKGPPSVTGLVGGATNNGTWILGGFHAGYWKEDNIRYLGALFKADVNIKFFGPVLILEDGVEMNMDAWVLLQQLNFRIAKSNFFIGGRYFFTNAKNIFEVPIDIPDFTGVEIKTTLSEISALFSYDSRNNVLTPTEGIYAYFTPTYSDQWFGGEDLYGRIEGGFIGFMPISERFNLGVRYDTRHALGDIPFWVKPFVDMRGVPLGKYQNSHVDVLETELTFNVYRRWHLKAFTGIANAYSNFGSFSDGSAVRNVGTGIRYELAKVLGIHMGMDFAWSNDDFGFYFVAGHAWMR